MSEVTALQQRLDRFFARYYPDPIIFTIGLTIITIAACLFWTDTKLGQVFTLWGDGLPSLLTFMAQLSLTLIFSHALANTGPVAAALSRLAKLPGSARQAYLLVGLVGSGLSLITWSLGLVGGAIIAKAVATEARKRSIKLNYPLLVATAYAAMCIWHMGYSSSSALFVATEGHAMEAQMGIVPMTQTVFTAWNGVLILVAIIVICGTALFLHSDDQVTELPSDECVDEPAEAAVNTPAEKLENSRWFTLLLATGLAFYLGQRAFNGSLTIDLNTVNWTLLLAVLIFIKSPRALVEQMGKAGPVVAPILLHYPFYAGMMALMIGSGLVSVLAAGIVASSSADTLPFYAFLSGGLLNIFIPSGGGQWAVQGPIFIEAATALGTPHEEIVMAVAYGDQWTNLIQPFWALPMLAIAGLKVRQILGFCFFFLLTLGAVFGGGILVVANF
ncbi:MAG: TIGR00366 family protein [Pseudomonadota bacterium]